MKAKINRPRRPSARIVLSRALNFGLWLALCAMSGTGLLLAFRLPPGSQGGHGLSALGLDRHEWGEVHLWFGYFFIIATLTHLALNWRWLWQVAARRRACPIWLGIGSGLMVALLLIFQPVQRESDRDMRSSHAERQP